MQCKKPLFISEELKILRCLKNRTSLSVKEETYYSNLEKGFEGEQKLSEWLDNLNIEAILLNDLLLECNNTHFQIDKVLITQGTLYFFEVKNYEGDYIIDGDRWMSTAKNEIQNPLLQLKRSDSLLRKILKELGCTFLLEAQLVFINPSFHLYQAPLNPYIIFPSQLNRFINKLNMKPSKLNNRHFHLAEKLKSRHIENSPFTRLPEYSFQELSKGIVCKRCCTFMANYNVRTLKCNTCGSKEEITAAVLRNIEEYNLLFRNRKINTNSIHEWCKILPLKTIRRILQEHFQLIKMGRSSYFI